MSSNANQNQKMNDLLRANAPVTSSTPDNPAANDAVNDWHRQAIANQQADRFATVWDRLMSAHQKELDWQERLQGDSDNAR